MIDSIKETVSIMQKQIHSLKQWKAETLTITGGIDVAVFKPALRALHHGHYPGLWSPPVFFLCALGLVPTRPAGHRFFAGRSAPAICSATFRCDW